jgi:hypothetical protein
MPEDADELAESRLNAASPSAVRPNLATIAPFASRNSKCADPSAPKCKEANCLSELSTNRKVCAGMILTAVVDLGLSEQETLRRTRAKTQLVAAGIPFPPPFLTDRILASGRNLSPNNPLRSACAKPVDEVDVDRS